MKKIFLTLFCLSLMGAIQASGLEDDMTYVVGNFKNFSGNVKLNPSSVSIIPKDGKTAFKLKSSFLKVVDCFKVEDTEEKLTTRNPRGSAYENPRGDSFSDQDFCCDFTHSPEELFLKRTHHNIHNSGYYHSCNEQRYVNCTLKLANNGCLTLKGGSIEEEDQGWLSSFIGNNLSKNTAKFVHEEDSAGSKCWVKNIKIRPYGKSGGSAPISGSVEFKDLFKMDLNLQGVKVVVNFNEEYQLKTFNENS